MRYGMLQCDDCCENRREDEADGADLCPDCADVRALEAEYDLSIEER